MSRKHGATKRKDAKEHERKFDLAREHAQKMAALRAAADSLAPETPSPADMPQVRRVLGKEEDQ